MILHHVEYGTEHGGEPIVFLGSIASTTDMWLPQLDALSATHRVIALDHRGHGHSPDPDVTPGETTFDHLAADVLETLDTLGVDKFAVVGLSLGGALAQYLTATSERVTRAAYLCTAAYFGGPEKWDPRSVLTRAEGMEPMADGVIGLWFTEQFRATQPATTAAYRNMVTSTRGVGYASCSDALATWDFKDRLKDITVPVLVLAGTEDESTPPAALHAIADGVTGEATYVEVSPGAHVPTVESPEQVNKALVEFFN
ncbi:3-oxoadipate enol-lactonase [Corynebacterium hylobatis]|uniref:3-oxoadipate enol-lactonase n=1 Tax=Corynebacterium hylobatis TaxID=1859290 RepID=A0A3S0B2V4_9CORY|nr:3-oxoadipate enol-lactonase [Corynebacterium hylobatis]RSZ61359.1 3-oxoadipate enol-lactonase [Corynebacterium hylobatis]